MATKSRCGSPASAPRSKNESSSVEARCLAMRSKVADWLDERTGYRALVSHALDEEIAGGARWAYVFGSGLLTIFLCQVVTGLLLMATYTPAVGSAWSSVFYIQHKVTAGWFVRGLHSYGAQAMILCLGLHLLQVALYGAYKK